MDRKSFNFLLFKIDVVVSATLVYNFNVEVLVFHDFVFNGAVVAVLAVVFNFTIDVRVLWEDFARKEFLRKGKSLDFGNSHIHELGFGVVKNVIVPKEAVT